MVQVAWLFWFSKIIELMDTVSSVMMVLTIWSLLLNCQLIDVLFRSDLLCVEEEARPDNLPSYLPPLLHALDLVVGSFLCSRWVDKAKW